jgi:Tol biopolymer transport system component
MKKNLLLSLVIATVSIMSSYAQSFSYSSTKPLSKPVLFAKGIINTPMYELNGCFTPDGNSFIFSINTPSNNGINAIIMQSEYKKGEWTTPRNAPFSPGIYSDIDPFISPDGKKLFFISNRPYSAGNYSKPNYDIYVVNKTADGWDSTPQNIGAPINDEGEQFFPSVATSGNLYFSTNKGTGYAVYCSKLEDGKYGKPEKLDSTINKRNTSELDNCISPDEKFIIFVGIGRRDTKGGSDLYISFNINGGWSEAINLGEPINSYAREFCPSITPDGKYLFFTSTRGIFDNGQANFKSYADIINAYSKVIENGEGNIYQIDLTKEFLEKLRAKSLRTQ